MAKTKEQKREIIKKLEGNLEKQKVIYFVDFQDAKTETLFALRKKLKNKNALFYAVKKKLAELAFKNKKVPVNIKTLKGQIGLIFGFGDEISPAKIIYEFEQEFKTPKILGCFMENEFLVKEKVVELAKLPSKQELSVKLINVFKSPSYGFINVLQGNIRGLITVLSNIK